MQLQSDVANRKYRNSWHCLQTVVKEEGIRGLYKGLSASYLGISESTIQFVTYEWLKAKLRERRIGHADYIPGHHEKTFEGRFTSEFLLVIIYTNSAVSVVAHRLDGIFLDCRGCQTFRCYDYVSARGHSNEAARNSLGRRKIQVHGYSPMCQAHLQRRRIQLVVRRHGDSLDPGRAKCLNHVPHLRDCRLYVLLGHHRA